MASSCTVRLLLANIVLGVFLIDASSQSPSEEMPTFDLEELLGAATADNENSPTNECYQWSSKMLSITQKAHPNAMRELGVPTLGDPVNAKQIDTIKALPVPGIWAIFRGLAKQCDCNKCTKAGYVDGDELHEVAEIGSSKKLSLTENQKSGGTPAEERKKKAEAFKKLLASTKWVKASTTKMVRPDKCFQWTPTALQLVGKVKMTEVFGNPKVGMQLDEAQCAVIDSLAGKYKAQEGAIWKMFMQYVGDCPCNSTPHCLSVVGANAFKDTSSAPAKAPIVKPAPVVKKDDKKKAAIVKPVPAVKKDKKNDVIKVVDNSIKLAEGPSALDKLATMFANLQQNIVSRGEVEAHTYDKFACWCKTIQGEKSDAIKTGKDDKTSLSADLVKWSAERGGLDKTIARLNKEIKESEKAMNQANIKSDGERQVYNTNEDDMKAAISALQEAMKALKASKAPSLVQFQGVANTVKQAVLLADALGLGGESTLAAASFFQASRDVPVEMEDYKHHSGGIISTLEKLLGSFREEKSNVDAQEVKRVQAHDMYIQDRTDYVKSQTKLMEGATADRDSKTSDIGKANQELSTVSATLLDDMEYLDQTNNMCMEKAKTWDQRCQARAMELTGIAQAASFVVGSQSGLAKSGHKRVHLAQTGVSLHFADAVANSDSSMEAIEAETESFDNEPEPVGFLQRRSTKRHLPSNTDGGRELIMKLLEGKGKELHSTLLTSLASKLASGGDPLAKVKKLIQELIERLLTEASNESTQKGWCDKATADATQKRQYAADDVEDLNAKMAELEAQSGQLGELLSSLAAEVKDINKNVADAEKERKEENKENVMNIDMANAASEAVQMAIQILEQIYATAAQGTVDLSLAQGPADDAPETAFKTGEAYTGDSGTAGGVIAMLEVIDGDCRRTSVKTTEAEKSAVQEHLAFMTESGKSLAEKAVATKELTRLKDEVDDNQGAASDSLDAAAKIVKTSIQELIELKGTCVDTGMSYADRVAMREQEIASLKKAMCILGAYAQYGPDGLSDAC